MRFQTSAGVTAAALLAAPAIAQPAAAPRPATDAAIGARLNALEARLDLLEAQNADLRRQLAAAKAAPVAPVAVAAAPPPAPEPVPVKIRPPYSPVPAASSGGRITVQVASGTGGEPPTQRTIVPEFRASDGSFTFAPRGLLDIDYAAFNERRGGYDYNNGTQIRRGRFGFDGTVLRELAYRIEAEYVGGTVSLLDAYVAYTGAEDFTIVLGQLKVPAGLEANSSDAFNEFLERGMANTAFGLVGGERRIGATFAYAGKLVTATGGLYGANESIGRNPNSPGEVWGLNGRVTLEPVNTPRRLIHVGGSAYRVFHMAGKDLTVGDRPDVRVDNTNLEAVAFTGAPTATTPGATIDKATFWGLEGAGVLGPVSVQGEYSHMHLDRTDGLPSANFDGFYTFASLFLTGEARRFNGGVIGRLVPITPFDPRKGQWGAFELAGRYDRIDLTDYGFSAIRRRGHSVTAALNWYLTGNVKVMLNYIRFTGSNSPLVAAPISINGTTAKGDAFAARVHLDF